MSVTKTSYKESYNKKKVQEAIFQKARRKDITKVVGLAGPDIGIYLDFLKANGIKSAEIYEKDPINLLLQLNNFNKRISTKVFYQDIINADFKNHILYDFDFCCTVDKIEPYVEKFTHNTIITLALRGIGIKDTLEKFCSFINKKRNSKQIYNDPGRITYNYEVTEHYKVHVIGFLKKTYYCYHYRDSSPMVTIVTFPKQLN